MPSASAMLVWRALWFGIANLNIGQRHEGICALGVSKIPPVIPPFLVGSGEIPPDRFGRLSAISPMKTADYWTFLAVFECGSGAGASTAFHE